MISLNMIVKNEEKYIERSISSVKSAVGEIIIVDNQSTDNTISIARAMGAKVISSGISDNFSELRNLCLRNSKGDWILTHDADEIIAESNLERLIKLTETKRYIGFRFPYISYLKNNDWFILFKLRLFKNQPKIRWEGIVHESVTPSIERLGGEIGEANIFFHHYGFLRDEHNLSVKRTNYIKLMKKALEADPKDVRIMDFLGIVYNESGLCHEAIAEFKKALEIDPKYARARYNLAMTYFNIGKPKKAVEEFKKAIEINPEMLKKISYWSFLV